MKKEKVIKVKLQKDYKLVKPRKQKRERKTLKYAEEPIIGEHGRTQGCWVELEQEPDGTYLVVAGDERGQTDGYETDEEDDAYDKFYKWKRKLEIED